MEHDLPPDSVDKDGRIDSKGASTTLNSSLVALKESRNWPVLEYTSALMNGCRSNHVYVLERMAPRVLDIVARGWRNVHNCWSREWHALLTFNHRFALTLQDHQRFFFLPCGVPTHRGTGQKAYEAASHSRSLRNSCKQGAIAARTLERDDQWMKLRFSL